MSFGKTNNSEPWYCHAGLLSYALPGRKQFLGTVAAALLSLAPLAAAFAADPAIGSTDWNTTYGCAGCHVNPMPNNTSTQGAFSGMGSTIYALSTYANIGGNVAGAANPGWSPIPAGNTYGCNLIPTTNTATCYMSALAATLGSNLAPTAVANDIAAFFASYYNPVVNNPGTLVRASGSAFSLQLTGSYFLTSATWGWSSAFSTTATGITFSTTSAGLVTATLPTVSAPTNYTVTVASTNLNTPNWNYMSFTLTVNPPVPVVTSPTVANVLVNSAFSYTITGTNTPTKWWGSGTLPTGLTPNISAGASVPGGLISGIPTQIGSFPINVWAGNVTGWSAAQATTINVWGITSAATASGTVGTVFPGYTITTNGTLSGANPYSSTALPAGLTLNTANGAITGTPTTAGTYNVTVSALTTLGTTSKAVSFTIAKGNQTITFGAAPNVAFNGTGTVTATATSGLAVSFSSTTPATCSVTGSTVTGLAAGANNCTIAVNQAGDANWNAATQVTQTFSIGPASQTITGFTAPASLTVGGTGTVSATGGASGNPVVFSSTTPLVCSATGTNGSTITGLATGTCTIAANQAGNTNYAAAPQVTTNIAIGLSPQTITFGAAPTVVYPGTGTITATASSGLAVTFATATPGTCSVTPTSATTATVTGLAAGTNNCTITADQAGNGTFATANQATQTFSILKANQSITFGTAPTLVVGGTATVSATATSALTVTYSSTTPSICSVTGTTVTGIATGTCTIAANQAGNTNYNPAPQVTQNIVLGQGSQIITFGAAPAVSVGGTGTVIATATSGLAVSYNSSTATTCSVNASTGVVTGLSAGTCTIAANQAGNVNWLAAPQVTQNIAIGKSGQTIGAISFSPATLTVAGTTTASATATSGLAVAFTSLTTGVCTVSGSTITGVSAGTCTIAANQAGNANYAAAPQVAQNIAIGQGSQTIGAISFSPATLAVAGTTTASATATSGLAVTFTSLTTGVCTVSGSTITGVSAGACTIAANQAGNANYTAAPQVTQSLTVSIAPAPAVTVNVQLNTPTTIDLSYIAGATGVSVSTVPAHGTVTVNGTRIIYTPTTDYFGTDSFTYVYYASGNVSSPATITITIIGRPDPTRNADVTGLINLETETGRHFRQAQIINFQQRLESLHHAIQASPVSNYSKNSTRPGIAVDVGNLGDKQNSAQQAPPQPGGSMQTSQGTATARNNNGAGAPSSVLLANTIISSLTTSAINLNLATLTNNGRPNNDGDLKFWGAGNLRYGSKNQPGGGSTIDFTTNGVSLGLDRRFGDQLSMGMGIGYARDKSTIGTGGTGSTSTGNSVAAYASYQASSVMFIDGLLGYGTLNMDTTRYVAPINSFARSNRPGSQTFVSLSTGYEYRDEGLLLSPYARYDQANDKLKAASETGAGLYALNYANQSTNSKQMSLGFRAESQHQIGSGTAQPRMRIEYQHHIEGAGQTSIAYADLLSTRYSLTVPTTNSNSTVLGIGSGFALRSSVNLDIDYMNQHSSGQGKSQAFNFRLSKQLD